MKISGYGRIAIATVTIIIAAVTIVAAASGYRKDAAEETLPRPVPVDLNATLTNEMSDTSAFDGFDRQIREFMKFWELQGASLSIMRNDSLVYSKGYGLADLNKPMQPGNILRMASVSKLVTAVGIMVLQEKGLLSLNDKAFGPEGILNDSLYNAAIKDPLILAITIEDLLRHKSGLSRKGGDPMFSTRFLMMQNGWRRPPTKEQLMVFELGRPLDFEPGTWQSYSNIGYLALSMIIEKISGQTYENFIQENVLHPAGCYGFRMARDYYEDKYPEEVRYFVQKDDTPVDEFNNSGRKVTRSYGGNHIEGLSGAGGWVASTPELALFVASIDGKQAVPDIISRESVEAMTEYFDQDTYSLGWNDTKPTGEWTRTGTFAGTSALVKYFPDGECWVFITNTSTYKGPGLARFTTELFEKLRGQYSERFPKRNFFYGE